MKRRIDIFLDRQLLEVSDNGEVIAGFPVSTAENGPGEHLGSHCTPRGLHRIAEKIGDHAPLNAVFIGRKATGEIWSPELSAQHPERDWILTRILWLDGQEEGRNLGGDVDTRARFIYIHGTPDSEPMGVAASHGCIRMLNEDVVRLFDLVDVDMDVIIHEVSP